MTPYTHLDTPPDDASIWRYVNLEKFLSMLQSRQLFFASLDGYDDPYEGYFPEDVWQQYIKPLLVLQTGKEGRLQLSDEDLRRVARKQCYVSCWYLSPYDSAAMWSLYSGRAGVAIKSTFKRLRICLAATAPGLSASIGLVRYVDYSTVTASAVGRTPAHYLKRKSFEHEKEVRAVIIRHVSEATAGIPVPVDLDSLIEEIVVEPRAKEWVTDVVSDVVQKYRFTFKVRRSDLYTLA